MSAKTLAISFAALTFPVLVALPAIAADPPNKASVDEGRDRFKRGVELFKEGDYRGALIEFRRANEVAPNPKIQFNIGQTCLELQDYACALRAFEKYQAEVGAEIPKDRRQFTDREVARLKGLVGWIKITVNKDGAEVLVDDVSIGRAPLSGPALVGTGRHKITVTLSPLAPSTRMIDVAGGDQLDVSLELVDKPEAPPPAAPIPSGPAPDATQPTARVGVDAPPVVHAPSRTPFWIGVAVTGALGVGTAVTGAMALSAQSDLDKTVNRSGVTAGEQSDAQNKVKTFSVVSDILLGATAVGAIVTTVLYFTTKGSGTATVGKVQLRPGLGGLAGTF